MLPSKIARTAKTTCVLLMIILIGRLITQQLSYSKDMQLVQKSQQASFPTITTKALTVREECLEPKKSIGTDGMVHLRMSSYACEISNVNLDDVPAYKLPLTYHSILDQIDVICKRKLRVGKMGDGGWEVCDDLDVRPVEPCIVYSFGINWDFSFDDEVSRLYGCHVYSFDPSMGAKTHNRSGKIHFYNYGLGEKTGHTNTRFPQWQMYTFKDIREMLGHTNQKIDIVKMDIEHSEWAVIPDMVATGQMRDVRQLYMEYHAAWSLKRDTVLPELKVIQSLAQAGFKKFDVHKNWHCPRKIPAFPGMRTKCYEVHYLQRY